MSRVLACLVLVVVFTSSLCFAQSNRTMRDLVYEYELSQNTMNLTLVSQVFSQNATALLPAGSTPIVGNGNITAAYAAIFAQLVPGSLNEIINVETYNNDYAGIEKTFNARVGNCSISLPVIQWFRSADNITIDYTGIVYNATAFANEANCNGAQSSPPFHNALVYSLFQTYEVSQNTLNTTLAASVFSNDAVVLLPAGSGQQVVGNGNITNTFVAFFGSFQWINEIINTVVINNNAVGVQKSFTAMTVTNCSINVPVVQWFFTNANYSQFDYMAAIFNTTLLAVQGNCQNNSNTNGGAASMLTVMWGLAVFVIAMMV